MKDQSARDDKKKKNKKSKGILPFFLLLLITFCGKKEEKTSLTKTGKFENNDRYVITAELYSGLDRSKTARFFAVGHKFNFPDDITSEKSYYESFRKFMEIIKPYLSKEYQNIVVFEEHAGLPLIFFGSRGESARKSPNLLVAGFNLSTALSIPMEYYKKKFPNIAPARQLFLSLTDSLWRVFYNTFSRLAREYEVFVVSCQNSPYPHIEKKNPDDNMKILVDEWVEDNTYYYESVTYDIWNTCFIFSPKGEIVHTTKKVNLVPTEKNDLMFSSGSYEELSVYRIPQTEIDVCIAISLDAFVPEYIKVLDEKGCDVLLQPDANSGLWASQGGLGYWQPEEWLASVMGSIQKEYYIGCTNPHQALFYREEGVKCEFQKIEIKWTKNIRYNVNPMMVGNLFDNSFDGQTAITGLDKRAKRDINYIGNPPLDSMNLQGIPNFKSGGFIVLGPWHFDIEKNLPIEEQRKIAVEMSKKLTKNGEMENNYISTIAIADLSLDETLYK